MKIQIDLLFTLTREELSTCKSALLFQLIHLTGLLIIRETYLTKAKQKTTNVAFPRPSQSCCTSKNNVLTYLDPQSKQASCL